MSGTSYETFYGVGLLDDLHNYFPALLYDQGRFQNVQQVFSYVRSQMNQRFNLYNFGAEQYRTTHVNPIPFWTTQPVQVPAPHSPIVQNEHAPRVSTTTPITPTPPFRVVSLWEENDAALANELLSLLGTSLQTTPNLGARALRSRLNPNAPPFFQPVVVRPSAQAIENNSEILTGVSGILCTICQESIEATARCRRLRACQHTYHQSCIDTWFQESIHCPTCRHDIRERERIQPS